MIGSLRGLHHYGILKSTMGEQAMQLPGRCSWILEKFDDEWKIVHFHKSVGAAW